MPELPEVEVTRRGMIPHLVGQVVSDVVIRHHGLRWPFPSDLALKVRGQLIHTIDRRGKYLLLQFNHGTLIIHLGMSGRLRIHPLGVAAQKHEHFDLIIGNQVMRMSDARRFGAVLWHDAADGAVHQHSLLRHLGMEPWDPALTALTFYRQICHRRASIKQVLLAGNIIAGIGNIYACESLFKAGIHPQTAANLMNVSRCEELLMAMREILATAIQQGGSSLRDFMAVDGQSGYFQQNYYVYNRAGMACRICAMPIQKMMQGQRSTFYCAQCQQ